VTRAVSSSKDSTEAFMEKLRYATSEKRFQFTTDGFRLLNRRKAHDSRFIVSISPRLVKVTVLPVKKSGGAVQAASWRLSQSGLTSNPNDSLRDARKKGRPQRAAASTW
jgi:uncharacterized protein YwlG (UPF0340 family)